MQYVKHVVLIPVGPGLSKAFVRDTLDSIRYYTDPDRRIVIVDSRPAGDRMEPQGDDVDILVSPFGTGMGGTLHLGISAGIRFALERFRFDVLLRLDDDSLVVGPCPEDDAIARFRHEPSLGVLGSYHLTCEGHVRDLSWAAARLHEEMDDKQVASEAADGKALEAKLGAARTLRDLYRRARSHGYVDGEHCLGAAVYFSYPALQSIAEAQMLVVRALQPSLLGEDHLRGLLVRACGLETAEFEQGADPLCLDWLQLPCSPARIVERGKKIVHTVKKWKDMDQAAIREFFRQRRDAAPARP